LCSVIADVDLIVRHDKSNKDRSQQ